MARLKYYAGRYGLPALVGGLALLLLAALGAASTASRETLAPPPPTPVSGIDLVATLIGRGGTTTNLQTGAISGSIDVNVVNRGTNPVATAFSVLAFVDNDRDGLYAAGGSTADVALGTATVSSLGGNTSASIALAVSGDLGFRDNIIAVLVDRANAVAEVNESNNVYKQSASCAYSSSTTPAPIAALTAGWRWSGSSVQPASRHVQMTPAVADLNLDGVPDVVFSSFENEKQFDAHLRAISGSTGAELFTVTASNQLVNPRAGVAVGNIDADSQLEVIAVADASNTLLAFEHTGALKWRSASVASIWAGTAGGAPALANLDGAGLPEIVYGGNAFKADGTLLWQGAGGQGNGNDLGPLAVVANLDAAGAPEVVAGNTAYRSNGTIFWQKATLPDGATAIANLDADALPEIVLVGNGQLYLLNHDGSTAWGPKALGVSEFGGPPLVVDVDNDGYPEIGVAGEQAYYLYRRDGTLRWSKTIADTTGMAGATAFDIQGDGLPEIIFRDQAKLAIWHGGSGQLQQELASSSSTWQELPIVADVNGDTIADLLVVSDSYLNGATNGVQLYPGTGGSWMSTRPLWNQHSYHVTNVDAGGAIPLAEADSWLLGNSYRVNAASTYLGGPAENRPDLTVSRLALDTSTAASSYYTLRARVGNAGFKTAAAGTPVSFYADTPTRTLVGRAALPSPLAPGQFLDLTLRWDSPPAAGLIAAISAVADEGLALAECSETNNSHSLSLAPTQPSTGARLWLRSDAGVQLSTANGMVTMWADQSGFGNNASMGTASRQPALVASAINGRPVIRFNGAQSLALPGPLTPSAFTIFVVGKNNRTDESYSMILGPNSEVSNNQLRWQNGTTAMFVGLGNGMPVTYSTVGNTRVYHSLAVRYDGTTLTFYRDGAVTSTHPMTSTGPWSFSQIGGWFSSDFMVGDLAEVLYYPSVLADADVSATHAYLRGRYQLP